MSPIIEFFIIPASPVLALFATVLVLISLECLNAKWVATIRSTVSILGTLCAFYCTYLVSKQLPIAASTLNYTGEMLWLTEFSKGYLVDAFSLNFYNATLYFLLMGILFIHSYFEKTEEHAHIFILLLTSVIGILLLISSNHLLMFFLALELLSLPTYAMVGIQKKNIKSTEAALKYFLFGSLASVFLLLGITLLYAQCQTMQISLITDLVKTNFQTYGQKSSLLGAMILFMVSFCFKVGIVPFHMWLPDVYEGAPAPITGFMGSAIKLAGFAVLLKVFWGIFAPFISIWGDLIGWLAVASILLGNLAAFTQTNLKRLLAYSSISHAGYLLLGITAITHNTLFSPTLYYYLVVYGLMFLGIFAFIAHLEKHGHSTDIKSLSGLSTQHPILSASVAVFSLSAAGIPPTAGFFSKYLVFYEVVKAGHTDWVILAALGSLIGVFYYLRLLVYIYMKEASDTLTIKTHPRTTFAIVLCALCLLYFSFAPYRLGIY